MDAFYASVEQRDQPALRGQPVAVGGSAKRGVIAAASYEAREYGVRSAMPSSIAKQKCRHLIFVPPRFAVYKEVSQQIREIFYEYTDLVEPLSLDEAFLDVTENKKGMASATMIANEIRKSVFEQTSLTCSAGISMNKFLAKTASDINKPNGYCLIHPSKAQEFVEQLPVKKFFGIGKATETKMKRMGISTGLDLKKITLEDLIKSFGKSGKYYYNISRAIDHREVKPDRKAKSISVENTFTEDLEQADTIKLSINRLIEDLDRRFRNRGIAYKTVVLKVRFNDFETISRNRSLPEYTMDTTPIKAITSEMMEQLEQPLKPIRLLGVGVQNLLRPDEAESRQLTFEF